MGSRWVRAAAPSECGTARARRAPRLGRQPRRARLQRGSGAGAAAELVDLVHADRVPRGAAAIVILLANAGLDLRVGRAARILLLVATGVWWWLAATTAAAVSRIPAEALLAAGEDQALHHQDAQAGVAVALQDAVEAALAEDAGDTVAGRVLAASTAPASAALAATTPTAAAIAGRATIAGGKLHAEVVVLRLAAV